MSRLTSLSVEDWLKELSLDDKIGQMSQIDLNLVLQDSSDGHKEINASKVEYYIGELGIGSVLNNVVDHYWNASQYRRAIQKIQQVAASHGRPPVIYGLDSVHGANYVHGATLTPQPINIAASFNTSVAYRAGIIASRDTRAAGITWLFSPLLGIALQPFWSRVYETFGEDPHLVGNMALAMIQGIQLQGEGNPSRAAACAKHYIGYSAPQHGHDRAPSWIPKRHLYQYFVPPWRAVAKEVKTIMEDYTEFDGVPVVANREALNRLLRFQLGFRGMVVTDYSEIWNLKDWHHIVSSREEAVAYYLQEGSVDMSMIPFDAEQFAGAVRNSVQTKQVSTARVDESVRRILELKYDLGMMHNPLIDLDDVNVEKVGSDRAEALDMAHQSIVLVKNEHNVLPILNQDNVKVLVTGPTANSLSFQSGGWSWQWQGPMSDEREWFTYGNTVKEAAQELLWTVTYECGVDILGNDCQDGKPEGVVENVESWIGFADDIPESIKTAASQAAKNDYVIVCIGEENYTEKPGDISDLNLPLGQVLLVREVSKHEAKVIVLYFGGRTRLLSSVEPHADAVLLGFLPGPDAGKAVIDIVSGLVNPSGRLPVTYPKHQDLSGTPYFHAVSDQCTNGDGHLPHWQYVNCDVQWPFGHGLSYTNFEYSNLQVSSDKLQYHAAGQKLSFLRNHQGDNQDEIEISVVVTNRGAVAGTETVLFFSFDMSRVVTPEYKRLRAYKKIYLEPGQVQTVTAKLSMSDPAMQFIGPHDDSHLIVQDGLSFRIGVGSWTDCRLDDSICSSLITVAAGEDYIAACDVACGIWSNSHCSEMLAPHLCWTMCSSTIHEAAGLTREGW
jgi:beta-glucosidase